MSGPRFRNLEPARHAGVGALLRWGLTRQPGPWPPVPPEEARPGPPPPARVGGGAVRVTFVNHATTLVQMDGLNLLTDPIWSERASPLAWAGPRRRRPPGIRFADLPPIDLVLVSHDHFDHMDLPTLRRLGAAHRPRVLCGLGNRARLARAGVDRVEELDWWASADLGDGARATFVPSQHFSSRTLADRDRTLWGGFVLSGPAGRVYFAGDTGWGGHFALIRQRLGAPRVALVPIGAYRPEWFMSRMHISPAKAVRAHVALEAATSIAIHFGTFRLSDEGRLDPPADLARALDAEEAAGRPRPRFWILAHGEGREVPR